MNAKKARQSEYGFETINEDLYQSIPEVFSEKSVFITGATGFLGKILVEKLLRSCPRIKNIYLLVRPKKQKSLQERLNQIFNVPLFDIIRQKQPDSLNKVIAIAGDIKMENLGIAQDDQEVLIKNVSFVFHAAATVRFDEKIREAVEINVKGTQRLMELSRKMINLKAFVYVSTAYSNCDRREVAETFYDIPFNSQAVMHMTDNFPDDFLDKCTNTLIGSRPNTYTFTKAIAEDIIRMEHDLPIAIIRPSIVTSTMNEPFKGWIDSIFGPTAVVAANSKGIFHTMLCDGNSIVDLIPADMVINIMIVAAWKIGISKSPEKLIYNITTSMKNPITWKGVCDKMFDVIQLNPFEGAFWYPTSYITTNRFIHAIYATLVHFIPAHVVDFISRLYGQKPMLVNIQKRLASANESLEFFKLNEFKFHSTNIDRLISLMHKDDVDNFPIDPRSIDWKTYLYDYTLGIRQYVFKQDPSSIEQCKTRMWKLKVLHHTLKILVILFFIKLFLFDFNLYEIILKMMFWLIPAV